MKKEEFLTEIGRRLYGLSTNDVEERIEFFREMIDESMEDGMTEEEAVAALGSVDEIEAQVMSEIPFSKLIREKVRPASSNKSIKTWQIVLLVLGFPIWFSVLVVIFSLVFSFFVTLWSIVLSLFAICLSLLGGMVASFTAGAAYFMTGSPQGGVFMIGVGLFCIGLFLVVFALNLLLSKGILALMKAMTFWIKRLFVGREGRKNA